MKTFNTIKLTTKLTATAVALAFSSIAISATESSTESYTGNRSAITNDWQSSLVVDFVKLDSSGNGLVMPHEALQGKAFNKKTFAAADTDSDGTIDQAEYVKYKTSMGETNQPAANSTNIAIDSGLANMSSGNASSAKTSIDQPEPTIQTAEMTQDNEASKKRSVGVVIDDSVITTKAKAAIFNTPDLKTLDISVQTRQGEVVLTGVVADEAAKMKAEEVVRNVGGVNSVTNNLTVKS